MATVGVVIKDTTPQEEAFFAVLMEEENAKRVAAGLEPFRDIEVLAEHFLQRSGVDAWDARISREARIEAGDTMQAVVTTSNLTAEEQRAADWQLEQINNVRVAHGEEPWATLDEWLGSWIVVSMLPQWVAQEAAAVSQTAGMSESFAYASDPERVASATALGIEEPAAKMGL